MATELIARLNFFFYIKSNLYSFEAYNKNFKWRITLNLDKDRAVPLILNTLGFTFFFVSSEIFSLIARVSHHESVFFKTDFKRSNFRSVFGQRTSISKR